MITLSRSALSREESASGSRVRHLCNRGAVRQLLGAVDVFVNNSSQGEHCDRHLLKVVGGLRRPIDLRQSMGTWTCLLPPVLTVVAAVALKQVLVSLFFGLWLGASIVHQWNVGAGLLRALE